jgi:hypothetical protein
MIDSLNLSGFIFVTLAWGTIIGTTIFCFKKILNSEKHKKSIE